MVYQETKKFKINIVFLSILTLACIIILFLIFSPIIYGIFVNYSYNSVNSTDLSQERLMGVSINSEQSKITGIINDNIVRKVMHDNFIDFEYGDTRYLFIRVDNEGIISLIRISGYNDSQKDLNHTVKRIITSKGITVGDAKKDIISIYGSEYYTRTDNQGFRAIGYVDRNNSLELEFRFNEYDKVFQIVLSRK